eukprot:bmy_18291T0
MLPDAKRAQPGIALPPSLCTRSRCLGLVVAIRELLRPTVCIACVVGRTGEAHRYRQRWYLMKTCSRVRRLDSSAPPAAVRAGVCVDPGLCRGIARTRNIVAVGAGFCDGLRCGDNTKAAVIRLGLMEMIAFARIFCKGQVSTATFLESCGVADLITTCYGGRNRRVAEAFARTGKTIEELEKEMLNGQKLQGPQTSAEVYRILKQKGLLDKFPLFTAVYQICYEGRPVQEMLSCLQSHPEHT